MIYLKILKENKILMNINRLGLLMLNTQNPEGFRMIASENYEFIILIIFTNSINISGLLL